MVANISSREYKIVIVGGGFGGVRCALDLAKRRITNAKIILISDKPYFEYTPALYRVATGRSPAGACVRLQDVAKGKAIEVLHDTIENVDLAAKKLKGSSGTFYSFDFLVLALGSETAYFGISGLKNFSFGFKTINEALRLKRHLHEVFDACLDQHTTDQNVCSLHFVVIGGGATGVELAGELAVYVRKIAKRHNIDPSLTTIDLIEAGPRLLSALSEKACEKITGRLRHLGVNIFLNRPVIREDVEEVYLRDMELKTKTVVWAAGVRPNRLYSSVAGLQLDERGRVVVDEYMQPKGLSDVFIIGDAAATLYSGMAQTAIKDGSFVAKIIYNKIEGKKMPLYSSRKPLYALPIGPNWGAVITGRVCLYGRIGWWLRYLADLRFFFSILPARKALEMFFGNKNLCEACQICEAGNENA